MVSTWFAGPGSIGFCHGFVPNSLLRGLLCDNFTTRKSLFARVGGLLLRQHRLLFRDCFTLLILASATISPARALVMCRHSREHWLTLPLYRDLQLSEHPRPANVTMVSLHLHKDLILNKMEEQQRLTRRIHGDAGIGVWRGD
jgi:hypothetical protein